MRILHVIPQFPYFGERVIVGGHASCLLTLSLAQQHAGHSVDILSYSQGRSGSYLIDDVNIHCLFDKAVTRTIRFGAKFYHAAMRWIGKRKDFDVVHCHSGYADYFLVSSKLKKMTGLPTLHTMYCPIPLKGGRWRTPFVHGMIARWSNQLDWVGAISQNAVASMESYGMKDAHWMPPAVDLERFNFATKPMDEFRAELGIKPNECAILFVGNAKRQKNLIGVLHAFSELQTEFPHVRLVVTTELKHTSSNKDMNDLRACMEQLGISDSITQMGIVDDMPKLMQACDILVAPFVDTFGPSDYFMAALEAMACGKPVVVSDVGGMPEVVTEKVGRLVNPNDSKSIASGLRPFVADKPFSSRTGANARARMEELFAPSRIVHEYDSIYSRLTT